MSGIVYFIQPSEFISSDIYKIGYSKQPLLNRIKQYGNKTSIKCIFESSNVINTEKKLISKFNENFDKFKGKEYFICKDVVKAKNIFYEVCNSPFITNDNSDSINDTDIDTDIDTDKEVSLETNLKTKEINQQVVEKIYQCKICKYYTTRRGNMKTHKTSKKHLKNIEKIGTTLKYECKLCNYKTDCLAHYNQHLETRKHKNVEKETKEECGSNSKKEQKENIPISTKNLKELILEITKSKKEENTNVCFNKEFMHEIMNFNKQLLSIIQNGNILQCDGRERRRH
jgi:hypothetical protein